LKKITISEIYLNILMGEIIDWPEISIEYELDDGFIDEFADKLNWISLCKYQQLSEEIIDKYIDKIDWYILPMYQKLTYHMIEKYKDKLSWYWLIACNRFDENFLWRYREYIQHMIEILYHHQTISDEFIKRLQDWRIENGFDVQ